jgi:hypothetical protein
MERDERPNDVPEAKRQRIAEEEEEYQEQEEIEENPLSSALQLLESKSDADAKEALSKMKALVLENAEQASTAFEKLLDVCFSESIYLVTHCALCRSSHTRTHTRTYHCANAHRQAESFACSERCVEQFFHRVELH